MITESNITLYSKTRDINTRLDIWSRYHIYDVHWEEVQGANIIQSGLTNADKIKVFIPIKSLDENIPRIKPDDYIVKEIIVDEITSTSELEKKYETAVKVKTADYRKDSLNEDLWHVEVGCE